MEPSVAPHRIKVHVPQRITDQHTLAAQYMAGALAGHPYRQIQQTTTVSVDETKPWREPVVARDKCLFCARMTDEEVERRVLGYQAAIDRETITPVRSMYEDWLKECSPSVLDVNETDTPSGKKREGNPASKVNRRNFLRENAAWIELQPFPMYDLPMRLQRKLVIQWNHLYVAWMAEDPVKDIRYDFEAHEFFRMTTDPMMSDEEYDPEDFNDHGYAAAMMGNYPGIGGL